MTTFPLDYRRVFEIFASSLAIALLSNLKILVPVMIRLLGQWLYIAFFIFSFMCDSIVTCGLTRLMR